MTRTPTMNETSILQTIRLGLSQSPAVRIFRNNVGTGWAGSKIVRNANGSITIHDPRPLHAGLCVGSSDLIGWQSVVVTQEMVGKPVAIFLAVEVKRPKKNPTPEQTNFLERVAAAGGISGVARSVEDARNITNQL